MTVDISASGFLRNRANGAQVITNGTGTIDVEITRQRAAAALTNNNIGINIAHNSTGTLSFDVRNATLSNPGLTGAA